MRPVRAVVDLKPAADMSKTSVADALQLLPKSSIYELYVAPMLVFDALEVVKEFNVANVGSFIRVQMQRDYAPYEWALAAPDLTVWSPGA